MQFAHTRVVRLASLVAAIACLPARVEATDVTTALATDTVWTAAGNPYRVTIAYPSRLVPDGVTLTLEPGVQVLFDGLLEIDGRLVAVGTSGARITLGPITAGTYPTLVLSRVLAGAPVNANVLTFVDITGYVNVSRQSLAMTSCTVTAASALGTPLISTYGGVAATYPDASIALASNTLSLTTSYSETVSWAPRTIAGVYLDGHDASLTSNTISVTTTGGFVTASGVYATASNTGASVVTTTGNTIGVTGQHHDTPSVHGVTYASASVSGDVEDNTITVSGPDHAYGIASIVVGRVNRNTIGVSSSSAEVYANVYGIQAPATSDAAEVVGNRVELWTDSQNRSIYGLAIQAGTISHNRVIAVHAGPSGGVVGIDQQYYAATILNNTVKLTVSGAVSSRGLRVSNTSGALAIRNNVLVGDGTDGSVGVQINSSSGTIAASFNVLHGWHTRYDGLDAGDGDVHADPLFADAALHLSAGSPAVDAGDWADAFAVEPAPNGGRIDAGAFGNTVEATASTAIAAPRITTNGGADFTIGGSAVTLDGRTSAASTAVLVQGSAAGVTYTAGATTWSYAGTLAPGAHALAVTARRNDDTSAAASVVVTSQPVPTVSTVSPSSGGVRGGLVVSIVGTGFVAGATTVQFGSAMATAVTVLDSSTLTAAVPAGTYGTVSVSVVTAGGTGTLSDGFTYVPYRRYFAEGATGGLLGFEAGIALFNPDAGDTANVVMRFQKGDGTEVPHALSVPPYARRTVDPATLDGLAAAEFSTTIESDIPIVADRTMVWGGGYGSHAETGILAPSTEWYLAEGATHSGFDLFYLVQNPGAGVARLEVTYLLPAPAPAVVKTYDIEARSRFNIWVDLEDERLAATDVSAIIRSDGPVIVERAMYRNAPGQLFGAGHNSAAIAAPATDWFFAEGATGDYFDEFVLIANPGATEASIAVRFLLPDGTTIAKSIAVAARSRANLWVDLEDPRLRDSAVSVALTSTNAVPVIAERAMWWPGPSPATWAEAHNAFGTTATGTVWALAEGAQGGDRHEQTYVLIANASSFVGRARVTLFFEDGGTPAVGVFDLLANSRFNVDPQAAFPEAFPAGSHRRFATLVESLGATPAQVVVERSMYSDAGQAVWAAGTDAVAARLR